MFTELFLINLYVVITTLVGLMIEIPIPTEMIDSIDAFFTVVAQSSLIFPIGTLINCLTIIFAVYALQFFFSFTNYIFRKIPTLS